MSKREAGRFAGIVSTSNFDIRILIRHSNFGFDFSPHAYFFTNA